MTQPAHSANGWKDGWYVVPYRVMFRDLDSFGHVEFRRKVMVLQHSET